MERGNFEVVLCKNSKPIKTPFAVWAPMGPRNHILDGRPDPPWEGGNIKGKGHPL